MKKIITVQMKISVDTDKKAWEKPGAIEMILKYHQPFVEAFGAGYGYIDEDTLTGYSIKTLLNSAKIIKSDIK